MIVDNDRRFRVACLTLLLDETAEAWPGGLDSERICLFDFLAANPLLLAGEEDDPDRTRLRLAGFDERAVSYGSALQRFVTRRQRLPGDLAWLVALGHVAVVGNGRARYRLTAAGQRTARSFRSIYARRYREAAGIVGGRLRRTTDRGLAEIVGQWSSVRMHRDPLGSPRMGP
jgi:hypothetical protein